MDAVNHAHWHTYVTDNPGSICPNNSYRYCMSQVLTNVAPPASSAAGALATKVGLVKETVTYMVMDDLVVKPLSSTSRITQLLIQFNVKDVEVLQEESVNFGMEEEFVSTLMHHKVPMALVSTRPRKYVENAIGTTGIEGVFGVIVAAEEGSLIPRCSSMQHSCYNRSC